MSLSFMMSSSSPSSLTSVPDHLPNSTRSPGFTSSDCTLPFSSGGAGADGDDLVRLRLFLRGVGDDYAAFGTIVLLDTAYDHACNGRNFMMNLLLGKLWEICAVGCLVDAPPPRYLSGHISTFKA